MIPPRHALRRDAPRYADRVRGESGYLEIEGLSKYYRVPAFPRAHVVRSLHDVSLKVRAGEIMGLVGESGCGKSTFARLVTRQAKPSAGNIRIDGEDWLAPRGEALRRKRRDVQLVFQDPASALDPRMTIGVSMGAPLGHHGVRSAAERRRRVLDMLGEVGLDGGFYGRYPAECSGGQLQRVVIGRALLLEPKLLICDEPTSALDASMKTQVLNLLADLRARRGLTMVMISHDMRVVRHLCDRIAVMYLGRLVEIAETEHLFEHPGHPYTQALIAASMLEETGLAAAAPTLRGEPPSPIHPPSGCPFHPRCAFARPDCATLAPQLKFCSGEHYVRCRHWEDIRNRAAPARPVAMAPMPAE